MSPSCNRWDILNYIIIMNVSVFVLFHNSSHKVIWLISHLKQPLNYADLLDDLMAKERVLMVTQLNEQLDVNLILSHQASEGHP